MKFSTLYAIISLASLAVAVAIAALQENKVLDGADWNCIRCRFAYLTKSDLCHSDHCVSLIVLVDLKFRVS